LNNARSSRPSTRTLEMDGERASARERILASAERTMADGGFHGVSMRDIAEDCGLHFSLITHYFGTKQQLLEAVFANRVPALNKERTRLLDLCVRSSHLLISDLVRAFCVPLFALARERHGQYFLRLQNIIFVEDGPVARQIKAEFYDPMSRRMVRLLGQARPDLPKSTIYLMFNYLVGATFGMLRDQTHAQVLSKEEISVDLTLREELVLQLLLNGLDP
jgi:AcrR family transcriptional regulator